MLTYWRRLLKYVSQINSGIMPQECTMGQINYHEKRNVSGACAILLFFSFFFNWTRIIFTAASAGIYQSHYNLPPYVLSCLLQSHVAYHWGVLFSCRLMSVFLKTIRNNFSFTKTMNLPETYKAAAFVPIRTGIFHVKKCAVILYILSTIHGEIQSNFSYTTFTKFLASCALHSSKLNRTKESSQRLKF